MQESHWDTREHFLSSLNVCTGHVTSTSNFPLVLCIIKWLKDTGTQNAMSLQPRVLVRGRKVMGRCAVMMGLQEAEASISLLATNALQDTDSISRDRKACTYLTEHPSERSPSPKGQRVTLVPVGLLEGPDRLWPQQGFSGWPAFSIKILFVLCSQILFFPNCFAFH